MVVVTENKKYNVNVNENVYKFFEQIKKDIINKDYENIVNDFKKMRFIIRNEFGIYERVFAVYENGFVYYAI